jgi:enoyl-CoA hydratase/carnithine racemase
MEITAEDRGVLRVLTMTGPGDLVVFDEEAHQRLGTHLEAADEDDAVRVVLLRGTARSFSVGADIDAFPEPPADPTGFVTHFLHANSLPERLRKPVLAVVDGLVTAGGFELALACDWIFATPRATFSLPEARFGLVAGYAVTRLAHAVGPHRARRLLMTGESLTATRAAEWGLPVTVADDPLAEAEAMGNEIARSAPHAVRIIKQQSVAAGLAQDPRFRASAATYAQLWNLPDTVEAISAWREGRSPVFRPLDRPWG